MKHLLSILVCVVATVCALQAREVYILNNDWKFYFKEENSSDEARQVRLPHTWNLDALTGDGSYRQTTANYERSLYIPAEWRNRRLFLRFYGVQSVADVFINGRHIGEHRGGWTAFTFEITDAVLWGEANTLAVVVSNAFQNDVLPTSTELNLYGGIYRDVELITTDAVAVSPTYYGTDGVLIHQKSITDARVEGSVGIMLSGKKDAPCTVSVDIFAPDGYMATGKSVRAKVDGKMLQVPFAVDNPELWSPAHPRLYTVEVAVGNDTLRLRTGFRRIEVTPEKKFTVNGRRVFIHGVALVHDRVPVGSALSDRNYDADLGIMAEMGANALRSVTAPHAPYLYDECDRRGVVAWIDIPLTQAPFLSDVAYFDMARYKENGRAQLSEIIIQNYNHPSVAMWGIFTHLRGRNPAQLEYVREMNALAKRLDTTRPTVACSNQDGDINFITDLIVWQQSVGWDKGSVEDLPVWQNALSLSWSHLAQAVCYGAAGTYGRTTNTAFKRGVTAQRVPESWQRQFHEGYIARVDENLFWGVWLNTLFDFGSSRYRTGVCNSGLVAFDHSARKDAFYLYRTLWNKRVPTLHIVGKGRDVRLSKRQCLTLYSSGETPLLTVNGDTVRVKSLSQGVFRTDTIELHGRNSIRAYAGGCVDSMELTIGNYLKRRQ